MKRLLALLLLALCVASVFGGCEKEADMIETMASEVVSGVESMATDATGHSGEVTDDDGVIGNEAEENSTSSTSQDNTSESSMTDNSQSQ